MMKLAGVKQETLAAELGLLQPQVSKLVNDHVEPTLEQVDTAARCCKCSRWTLTGGTSLEAKFGGECIVSLDPEAHLLLAYFASALTGLTEVQRGEIFADAAAVRDVCEDSKTLLYEPSAYTDPERNAKVPPERVYEIDHAQVSRSDFVILDTRYPSFGAGQELEIAKNEGIPVVLLIPYGTLPSRMVRGTCARLHHVQFSTEDELRRELRTVLPTLNADLLARRHHNAQLGDGSFASRLKERREKLHLDYSALGRYVGLAPRAIEQLEKGLFPNPPLRILEALALALLTSVSYLVDGVMRHLEAYDPIARRSKDNLHAFADANGLTRMETQALWTEHIVKFSRDRNSVAEARSEAVGEAEWGARNAERKGGPVKPRQMKIADD
jgi:transcriptional regulator with XRE-family HTH domain